MAKKAKKENFEEVQQENEETEYFDYTDVTYCSVWNESRNAYDMLTLFIHGPTEKVHVVREPTRYGTKVRALHDTMQRLLLQKEK